MPGSILAQYERESHAGAATSRERISGCEYGRELEAKTAYLKLTATSVEGVEPVSSDKQTLSAKDGGDV